MPLVTGEERENRSPVASHGRRAFFALVGLVLTFLTLYFVTVSTESGDTLRYAGDVVHHARGESVQFWEFGHLLWRPWGYVGLWSLGSWFEQRFGDTDVQAVARFFVFTNFICSLATLILFWDLLRQVVSLRTATLVAIAFCGANCFLDYISLGSAYLPALCFECLALWFLNRGLSQENRSLRWTCLAAISYATSILLWFPYIFVGFGMVCFILLWPRTEVREGPIADWGSRESRRLFQTVMFVVVLALTYFLVLSVGAAAQGIRSATQFKQWIFDSDSGWSQHLNLVRAATGVPRSLFELASDTILLKRWFFHDPYNPVHTGQLAGALFLKLALFYAGVAAMLWILARERSARPTLAVLLGAAVPLLFFAIVVFEPASTSRYLPLLPFLYLAAAFALAVGTARRLAYGTLVLLLTSALAFNVFTLTHGTSARAAEVHRERDLLSEQITGHAVVFTPTLHDAFYEVPLTRPIEHGLSSSKYLTVDVVEAASLRLLHWRAEFASRALQAWENGQEVWLSQHVLAARPDPKWPWVEGDDPRIRWAELPRFFRQFHTDRAVSIGASSTRGEGFVRLANVPYNKSLLEDLVAADPKFKHQSS